MKTKGAGIVLAIVSAAFVVALALLDARRASPGPISRVHAISASIDGDDCEACHGDSPSDSSAACIACHEEIGAQMAQSKGFHGSRTDTARCGRCHSEHHGPDFELAGAGAFALAGIPDRSAYAHDGLAFELGGDHTSGLACKSCHEHADDLLLAEGARRFLGESQDCATCHDDPHAGRLPDCRACHGETEPFARAAAFVHPETFVLSGAHAQATCTACHPRDSAFAIEAGGSESATRTARDCAACHPSPHAATFATGVAALLEVEVGLSCANCHDAEHDSFRAPRELSALEHAASGFPLVAPHDRAACTDCHPSLVTRSVHATAFADYARAHPGRSADDCAACHADPHRGQFDRPSGPADCLACHAREHFDPPTFGVEAHARTAFALEGAHADAACQACHEKLDGAPRVFRGTDTRCASCHSDPHGGSFARAGDPAIDRAAGADCATCHTSTDFSEVPAFDHAHWTSFALEGAHQEAACEACHRPRNAPDPSGRRFGRVAEHFPGDAANCATCHADAHGGFFARRPLAPSCADCHTPHGFEAAAHEFDHGASTGFVLEGAHARAECSTCHAVDSAGRRSIAWPATGAADCAACHADPHAGAFDRGAVGSSDCARCHSSDSFAPARAGVFDHGAWTGFALSGKHADASCASCHPPLVARDRAGRTTERARGTRCVDCHADPHAGQFAHEGVTDCATCHATGPDFLALGFDHQRSSRFALDATHARLSCSACHVPWPLPGGGSAIRYKPLGTLCGDCHDAGGVRR